MHLVFHDREACGELLDANGRCPRCNLHPEEGHTAFRMVPLEDLLEMNRSFLSVHRNPILPEDLLALRTMQGACEKCKKLLIAWSRRDDARWTCAACAVPGATVAKVAERQRVLS